MMVIAGAGRSIEARDDAAFIRTVAISVRREEVAERIVT